MPSIRCPNAQSGRLRKQVLRTVTVRWFGGLARSAACGPSAGGASPFAGDASGTRPVGVSAGHAFGH